MTRLVRPLSILLTVGSIPALIVGVPLAVYSGRLDKRAGRDRRFDASVFDAARGQQGWSLLRASRRRVARAQAARRPEELD